MINTRKEDLEKLDAEALKGSERARKTRDIIYKQSKDMELERLRRLLIEATKRGDLAKVEELERYISKKYPKERWQM